jgi:hypothetical protein
LVSVYSISPSGYVAEISINKLTVKSVGLSKIIISNLKRRKIIYFTAALLIPICLSFASFYLRKK